MSQLYVRFVPDVAPDQEPDLGWAVVGEACCVMHLLEDLRERGLAPALDWVGTVLYAGVPEEPRVPPEYCWRRLDPADCDTVAEIYSALQERMGSVLQ